MFYCVDICTIYAPQIVLILEGQRWWNNYAWDFVNALILWEQWFNKPTWFVEDFRRHHCNPFVSSTTTAITRVIGFTAQTHSRFLSCVRLVLNGNLGGQRVYTLAIPFPWNSTPTCHLTCRDSPLHCMDGCGQAQTGDIDERRSSSIFALCAVSAPESDSGLGISRRAFTKVLTQMIVLGWYWYCFILWQSHVVFAANDM